MSDDLAGQLWTMLLVCLVLVVVLLMWLGAFWIADWMFS